jgi:hypothetical protein
MVQEPTDTTPQMREYSHKIKQYLGCLIFMLFPREPGVRPQPEWSNAASAQWQSL